TRRSRTRGASRHRGRGVPRCGGTRSSCVPSRRRGGTAPGRRPRARAPGTRRPARTPARTRSPGLPRDASSGHCPPFCTKERTKVSAFVSSTESISSSRSSAAWAEAKVCPPVTASAPGSSSGPEPGAFRDCWDMVSSSYRWDPSAGADGSVQRLEDCLGVVLVVDALHAVHVGGAVSPVGDALPVIAWCNGQCGGVAEGGGVLFVVRGY